MHRAATSPVGRAPPDEIDHDRTHHARRVGHELAFVAGFQRTRLVEAQIGLVHQFGGVEQREFSAAAQAAMRQLAQVGIQQTKQLLSRTGLAPANGGQQCRYLLHGRILATPTMCLASIRTPFWQATSPRARQVPPNPDRIVENYRTAECPGGP